MRHKTLAAHSRIVGSLGTIISNEHTRRPRRGSSLPAPWLSMLAATLVAVGTHVAAQADESSSGDMVIHRLGATGMATFVTAPAGGVIPVTPTAGRSSADAADFLREHGHLFGVKDPARELVEAKKSRGQLGWMHTTYHQVYADIPVFSGVLKIHQRSDGGILSANGSFYTIPDWLDPTPLLSPASAAGVAMSELAVEDPAVELNELVVVDPGWYGDPFIGAHLAYHLIVSDEDAHLREAFFVDARSGEILDRWTLNQTMKYRMVYGGMNQPALPGILLRREGDPPSSNHEANDAYDYSGDYYDFFHRMFGRDGYNGDGAIMIATVHHRSLDPLIDDFCPNAIWNQQQTAYCSGMARDDVIGHEWTHAMNRYTAQFIYQNQSGMLEEHYCDTFGELVDLFNGNASEPGEPSVEEPQWATPLTYVGSGLDTPYVGSGLDTPNNRRTPLTCSYYDHGFPDGVRWLVLRATRI